MAVPSNQDMRIQVIIILLAIILVSCMPATTPTPTETPTPTLALTLTITPLPTSTAFPSQTVYPTTEHFDFSMLSPDSTKIIQSRDWVTFDILDIKSNKLLWSFSYDKAKFGKGDRYLPEAGYGPFYWSQNGKYIYMVAGQGWDGGVKYFGNMFGAKEGLERFDLDTGLMAEILPERYGGGYTFAISPDESGLVYVNQRETPLVLKWRDLVTDKEKILLTFDEKILDVGAFGWSPKMDRLIFNTLEIPNPDQQRPDYLFDFFVINLEKPRPKMVFQGFDHWLIFRSWNEQNQVFYTDWEKTVWQLDLESESLSPKGTATPSP